MIIEKSYTFLRIRIGFDYKTYLYNRRYPDWDKVRECPATEVIRARRELAQIDEALKNKWEEQKTKRKDMDEQWEEARNQALLLRQSFVNFDQLVRENVEKRERAEQKIKEEHERQEKFKREVSNEMNPVDARVRNSVAKLSSAVLIDYLNKGRK